MKILTKKVETNDYEDLVMEEKEVSEEIYEEDV